MLSENVRMPLDAVCDCRKSRTDAWPTLKRMTWLMHPILCPRLHCQRLMVDVCYALDHKYDTMAAETQTLKMALDSMGQTVE